MESACDLRGKEKIKMRRTSLGGLEVRLYTSNAGHMGLISSLGTRSTLCGMARKKKDESGKQMVWM